MTFAHCVRRISGVCRLALRTHIIDTLQLGRPGVIAVVALETSDGVVVFDTGPESTFQNVAAGLGTVGIRARDVRHVFLSHIHFDHAGAAFRFAELGATVYVHPRGAPHLIDPARLRESAARIFGDNMKRLWGEISAVPEASVRILQDNNTVRVGEFEIRAIETPGHASHHHVYHWDDVLFGGDVAGVRIRGGPPIPPFVPPELHIESWLTSLEKIGAVNPKTMYLPHFGEVTDSISEHLKAMTERVQRWSRWFQKKIQAGTPENELAQQFAAYEHEDLAHEGASQREIDDYEVADPSYMAVPAAVRYWRKYHGDDVLQAPSGRTN